MIISNNYSSNDNSAVRMAAGEMDSYSQNIRNQIARLQEQMQALSSHQEMSIEEKMKKRQEIQQKINDLNQQLRQHEIEVRNEKQRAKESQGDGFSEGTGNVNKDRGKGTGKQKGISQTGMEAMISADSAMDQANTLKKTAIDLKGKAKELQAELRSDSALGVDTTAKQDALADLEERAEQAEGSQLRVLGKADRKMTEAAEKEREERHETGTDKKAQEEEEKKPVEITVPGTSVDVLL